MRYPWAVPGQRVVCVRDDAWRFNPDEPPPLVPRRGQIFVIRSVRAFDGVTEPKFRPGVYADFEESSGGFYYVLEYFRPARYVDRGLVAEVMRRATDGGGQLADTQTRTEEAQRVD